MCAWRLAVAMGLVAALAAGCTPLRYSVRVEDAAPYGVFATHYDLVLVTTATRGGTPAPGVVLVQELLADMDVFRGDERLFSMHERRLEAGASYEGGEARDFQAYDASSVSRIGATRVRLVVRGRTLRAATLGPKEVAALRAKAASENSTGIFSLHRSLVLGTGASAAAVRELFAKEPIDSGDIELTGYEDAFERAEPVMSFELRSDQRPAEPRHEFALRFEGPATVPAPRHERLPPETAAH